MTLVVLIIAAISPITHKNPNKPSFNHNILAETSNSVLVILAQVKLAMLITAPPNNSSNIHDNPNKPKLCSKQNYINLS